MVRTRNPLATWTLRLLLVVGISGVVMFTGWFSLFRTPRASAEQSVADNFLYGSMGTEAERGVPYWVWLILPKVFPEYLPGPGGYASLGLAWYASRPLPSGTSTRTIGYERVGTNCALCHVSQVRLTADQGQPTFYPGGPGHQVRVQDYQDFLFKCAADPRFNATTLMNEIAGVTDLSTRESLLYRYVLIPSTRRELLKQRDAVAWQKQQGRPSYGPGRFDFFNRIRFAGFKESDDRSVGTADIPAVWNQKGHEGQALAWNGLSRKFHEVLIASALTEGAVGDALDADYLSKAEAYLRELPAPHYPLPIDRALASRGEPLFQRECAACHAPGAARAGAVIPLEEIGTDPERAKAWTQRQVAAWKALAARYRQKHGTDWNFDSFTKQDGYVSVPLDGIWLRGPYLHNGSVPNLRALLERPEVRPQVFYRGDDVLDRTAVGFVSDQAGRGARKFFRYDVRERGNSNTGHLYGTQLGSDDKLALVEYLKTL
jgi:mono/diheme cytochrome c family protein